MAGKKKQEVAVEAPRYGRFEIPDEIRVEMPALVKRIMGECIIVRAEHMLSTKSVVYEAICDDFEPLEIGASLPSYDPEYDQDKDELNWTKSEG